jgi:hypothetical protein
VIVPRDGVNSGWASPVGEIKNGQAQLSAEAYNSIALPSATDQTGPLESYTVYPLASVSNSGNIGTSSSGAVFQDTGQLAGGLKPLDLWKPHDPPLTYSTGGGGTEASGACGHV